MSYLYNVFGLNLEASFPIPELRPSSGPPQISVSVGSVPDSHPGPVAGNGIWYEASPGVALVKVERVGRFFICDGTSVTIDPEVGASENELRLFLLNGVLGILLIQRGCWVLHASVVRMRSNTERLIGDLDETTAVLAFAGVSGAGKSTLARALCLRGCSLLSDDLCVAHVRSDNHQKALMVFPGPSIHQLWADTIEATSGDPREFPQQRAGMERYAVPAEIEGVPQRLSHVYVLEPWNRPDVHLSAARASRKLEALLGQMYRPAIAAAMGAQTAVFRQTVQAASTLQVHLLHFPRDWDRLPEVLDTVERGANVEGTGSQWT